MYQMNQKVTFVNVIGKETHAFIEIYTGD